MLLDGVAVVLDPSPQGSHRAPAPTTGISFWFWVGLTFPRGAKSQMWFTAWPGDRGRQNPLSNAQGTPIPEASLRSSCCLSLVITGSLSLFMPLH